MKYKITITLALIILSLGSIWAQTISGKITDAKGTPISYANIALFKNDTLANGTVSTNGNFIIDNLKAGTYRMCISYIGFQDTCIIINTQKTHQLTIELSPINQKIDEISIIATKPRIESINNKLVMRVNNTMLKNMSSVTDVLKYLPRVVQTAKGLEVFGKGKPTFMINGKPVLSYSEVEALSPSEIEKIEIFDANAKYDASVQCIINIRTKKRIKYSGGQFLSETEISEGKANYNSKIWLRKDKNKLHHAFYYSSYLGQSPGSEGAETNLTLDTGAYNSAFDIKTVEKYRYNYLLYKFSYDLDTNKEIGIQVSSDYNLPVINSAVNSVVKNEKTYNNLLTDNTIKNDIQLSSFYNYTNSKNQKLSLILDYYTSKQVQHELINELPGKSTTNNQTLYNIYAGSIDYSIPLSPINSEITIGTKVYQTENKNKNIFNSNKQQTNIENVFSSDNSLIEKSIAIYTSANTNFSKKLSAQAGLRFENYERLINDNLTNSITKRQNRYFYPSLSLNYAISEKLVFSGNYSKKINRQAYDYVTGQNIYVNPYMYKVGNPYLAPEIDNEYSLNAQLFQAIGFQISYIDRYNYTTMEFGANDSVITVTYNNFKKQDLNVSLNARIPLSKHELGISANMNKPFFKYTYLNEKIVTKKYNYTFGIQESYNPSQKFTFNLSAQYSLRMQYDMANYDPMLYLNTSIQTYFFNKKLRIELSYSYNSIQKYTLKYKTLAMSHYFNKNKHLFQFSLRYKFNYSNWYKRTTSIDNELDRI